MYDDWKSDQLRKEAGVNHPKTAFVYHQDPGHGWLEVSQADMDDVGLSYINFSSCSYVSTDGELLFLEEDCDMPKFLAAYKVKYSGAPQIVEAYSDPCFIRDLSSNPV